MTVLCLLEFLKNYFFETGKAWSMLEPCVGPERSSNLAFLSLTSLFLPITFCDSISFFWNPTVAVLFEFEIRKLFLFSPAAFVSSPGVTLSILGRLLLFLPIANDGRPSPLAKPLDFPPALVLSGPEVTDVLYKLSVPNETIGYLLSSRVLDRVCSLRPLRVIALLCSENICLGYRVFKKSEGVFCCR
jgi:hypothetical protein